MRIVYMINLYPPYVVGGNEMNARAIVEWLRAHGWEVHILTGRGQQFAEDACVHQVFNYSLDEKEAIFLGGRRLSPLAHFRHHVFDPVTYQNVRRVVQKLQPELIISDHLYMASAAPLLAVRDAPCPVIAQVVDKWLLFNLVDWGLAVKPSTWVQQMVVNLVRLGVQRPLARRVRLDGMTTVSDFIRDLYVGTDFAPSLMKTTYLGIDLAIFHPGPEHPLGNPVRLMFAGALWEGKGSQVIIRALQILAQMDDLPPFHLDIFGDGAEGFKQYLRQVISNAGVAEQVTCHGFVPWEHIVKAMHQADIFVFPSIWDEPFATVPLQALACGLPLVATRAGGTPEGFVNGETALLIPADDPQAMADAIGQLVRDESLRRRLRENGIRQAQAQWGFDIYMNRLEGFFQHVTQRWKQKQTRWDNSAGRG